MAGDGRPSIHARGRATAAWQPLFWALEGRCRADGSCIAFAIIASFGKILDHATHCFSNFYFHFLKIYGKIVPAFSAHRVHAANTFFFNLDKHLH
jgi:hypothetical protein